MLATDTAKGSFDRSSKTPNTTAHKGFLRKEPKRINSQESQEPRTGRSIVEIQAKKNGWPIREDPFKPAPSYYQVHEYGFIDKDGPVSLDCQKCGTNFKKTFYREKEEGVNEFVQADRITNAKYAHRLETSCYDFGKLSPRKDITEGYYYAHDQRFVSTNATGFCGGVHAMVQSKVHTAMGRSIASSNGME